MRPAAGLFCGRVLHDDTEPRLLASGPSIEQIADFFAPEPPVQLRNSDGDELIAWHRQLPNCRVLNLRQIERVGEDFTVTANSPTRLAELEAHLRDVAPDAVERDRRSERLCQDPGGREARTMIVESYFLDERSAAEAGQSADRHEPRRRSRLARHSWRIGNLSPREAAASSDRAILTELRNTVDDIEATLLQAKRAGRPTKGLMNPHRLRDALTLENHAQ